MEKPFILVTNDDGLGTKGLQTLFNVMKKIGKAVVIAPDRPRSGMSHAITVTQPLRLRKQKEKNVYSCNGTPVDCVKLGMNIFDKKPDLIVSGVNHGSNASVNIFYSGTMAAAIEGAMSNIPAIGFSLLDYSLDAEMDTYEDLIQQITQEYLQKNQDPKVCLNVNFPAVSNAKELKGYKYCRQAIGMWKEQFEERNDPGGNPYYWLSGTYIFEDKGKDTDIATLEENFASVVPVRPDLTCHQTINMNKKENEV